jgi:excisionase family DNA binding protein
MKSDSNSPVPLEWLNLRQLTEYAAVSNRTLRAWIHCPVNPLPAVRVGVKILVRRSEFDAWMERHRIKQVDLGGMVEEIVEAVAGGR